MNMQSKTTALMTALVIILISGVAVADNTKATNEAIEGLNTMCSENAAAQSERQEKDSLYNRLGGYDKILKWTTELARLHSINDDIKHMFADLDLNLLAKHVADFVAAGTGGTAKYTGRALPVSHAHLNLTDADFLTAGGDIVASMKTMGYGQNEIDEMLCILMSLKDQVVFK